MNLNQNVAKVNSFSMARAMTEMPRRRKAIVTLAAMAMLAGLMGEVAAAKQRAAPHSQPTAVSRRAGEPIMAVVSLKSQEITIYDADGWILRAPVSTGTAGRETPAGVFAVVEKDRDHHSTLYDDAWMPHMQRITWNGIALHGGPLPGYAASHGCVRMPYDFAENLFDKTRMGMRVIISPDDAAPVPFSHPALLMPEGEAVASARQHIEALAHAAEEAADAVEDAKSAAAKASQDARSFRDSLREMESLKTHAEVKFALTQKTLADARTDEAKAGAQAQKEEAAVAAAEALAHFDTAKAEVNSKFDAAALAKEAVEAAQARKADAAKAANEARLALEPVSVFISRASQKVYVRRNTHKEWPDGGEIFDASVELPVSIRDPEKRIGTHVFTAMAPDGAGLRWSAVTIDNGDEAENALDRVTIPQEVLDRVAATVSPRSSIIISDEPLSRETNYRTEFVVVLSNQPQGGFITRRPSTKANFARSSFEGGAGFPLSETNSRTTIRRDNFDGWHRGW